MTALKAVAAVDDAQPVGEMVCELPDKSSGSLSVEQTTDRIALKISCAQARLFTPTAFRIPVDQSNQASAASPTAATALPPPAAHVWRVAYLKTEMPRLFDVRSGLRISPVQTMRLAGQTPIITPISPLHATVSRDEAEIGACIDRFKQYKSDAQTRVFVVTFFERVYHCEVASSFGALQSRRIEAVYRNDLGRFLTPVGPAWQQTPYLAFQLGPREVKPFDPDHPRYEVVFPETNIFHFESQTNPLLDPKKHECIPGTCQPNRDLGGNPTGGQTCKDQLGNFCDPAKPWVAPAVAPRNDQMLRFASWRSGTYQVQLQIVSTSPPTLAAPTPFADRPPSYQAPNPCENWRNTPNLVVNELVSATSRDPNTIAVAPGHSADFPGFGLTADGRLEVQMPVALASAPYVAELALKASDLIDDRLVPLVKAKSSQQQHDFNFYARIIPVGPATPTPPGAISLGPECAGVSSNWIRLTLHDDYFSELAKATELIAAEQAREVEDAIWLSVVGADGKKGSPVTVEFAGFTHPAGNFLGTTEYLPGFRTRPEGVPKEWPSAFGRNFDNDWPGLCTYNPADVLAWPTQKNDDESWFESAWDDLVNVVDGFANVYDLMKGFVVDGVAWAASGGQCRIDPLRENTEPESTVCRDLKAGLSVVESTAMAYAGLPPQLPLASALTDMAKGQVDAAIAAAFTDASNTFSARLAQGLVGNENDLLFTAVRTGSLYAGQQLGDYTQGLIDKSIDQVTTAFTCTETDDSRTLRRHWAEYGPILAQYPGGAIANWQATKLFPYLNAHPDMAALVGRYGYFISLDSRQCLSAGTDPYTWGTPDALSDLHPAILWLKVSKNPQSQAPRPDNVFVKIREKTRLTSDQITGLGIFQSVAAVVSMDAVERANGQLYVPVVLSANTDAYMNLPATLNEFGAHVPETAMQIWREDISGSHPDYAFEANWTYRWTNQHLTTRSNDTQVREFLATGALAADVGHGIPQPKREPCPTHGD